MFLREAPWMQASLGCCGASHYNWEVSFSEFTADYVVIRSEVQISSWTVGGMSTNQSLQFSVSVPLINIEYKLYITTFFNHLVCFFVSAKSRSNGVVKQSVGTCVGSDLIHLLLADNNNNN